MTNKQTSQNINQCKFQDPQNGGHGTKQHQKTRFPGDIPFLLLPDNFISGLQGQPNGAGKAAHLDTSCGALRSAQVLEAIRVLKSSEKVSKYHPKTIMTAEIHGKTHRS